MSKIRIIPHGQELSMLSETIDPLNIPRKYGGQHQFQFGMPPVVDDEIKEMVNWPNDGDGNALQELPLGPLRWVRKSDTSKEAIAVGKVEGAQRRSTVMTLR